MIENKFKDKFQNDQLGKYREFGNEGENKNWWSDYRVGLCGSDNFLKTCTQSSEWDLSLSFEEIGDWFKTHCAGNFGQLVVQTTGELSQDF